MSGTTTGVLTLRQLNRALLERQALTRRVDLPALAALEHLVGMQAQAPLPPYTGLWTRLARFCPEDLATLITDRQAVRLVLMRGTIHLVSAADCLALRPVLAAGLQRALGSTFGRQLAGVDAAEVAAEGRRLVEEEPLTLGGLGARLAERWPEHDPFALANAVRALVPLVQVPPRAVWGRSGQAVHTTAEAWLGRPLEADTAAEGLVLRYLAAFGPASVKDVQNWSGLTRLSAVVKALRPRLRTFRSEDGRELFDVPDAPLPDADSPAPVRFLPEFDNILLGHAERDRIISAQARREVLTRNGLVRATVLVDGFVSGVWQLTEKRGRATLEVSPFRQLSRAERAAVEEEGTHLLAFAAESATTHEVRIGAPD
ncbi:AlkZ family DNA glycosylase [Streptomyces sp. JJ66]|uniref:winged helix DNA-binding domain-containing protein n=1 Tax=Streptomyces sp. JJ66 TaxID=2803843 RepID=UPI001C59CC7F|nr:winged helix DNA-binding domain-containing protein [Streptomyces sp. JJ66]MBW1602503.1 AlkZ family DNA glycosylase [Streptomyces sp. JJ66]